MKFSQRIGKTPIKVELEREGMSQELRNSLWNVVFEYIRTRQLSGNQALTNQRSGNYYYFKSLWENFFKHPVDELSNSDAVELDYIRRWFFKAEWYEVLDFIEFSASFYNNINFIIKCNDHLSKEMSAYRFVESQLVEINSKEEVIEIEEAIKNTDQFNPVKTHLKTALGLLSDRKNPDYRNSVKESISAVEALVKIITKKDTGTLGKEIKNINKKYGIHPALIDAFDKLYGYTSNSGGIRHALVENSAPVDLAEARFMLVACSAFVNYLIYKTKLNNS